MIYKNFHQLKTTVQEMTGRKKVAVVAADDEHTLKAIEEAYRDNIIEPILIGNSADIIELLTIMDVTLPKEAIIHVDTPTAAAKIAVEMVSQEKADFLMKGSLQTAELMRVVVDKEYGLHIGRAMSHVAFLEIPTYPKLLAVTDGGMVLHPNLQEKKDIIENAVCLMLCMGYTLPKVAVMAAVETVNAKMQETVDAARLKQMNQEGILTHCLVEGPVSYDLAVDKESARIKGYESQITAEADIMIAPTLVAGNLMAKGLVYSGGAKMAGVIVGAKVPIVLTSRGSSKEEKFWSLVLAASAV